MDDFLTGREVISRSKPDAATSDVAATLPPLEPMQPPPPEPAMASSQEETGDHGTRVETVVERGRVTRLIVTCACGTVTEIECRY